MTEEDMEKIWEAFFFLPLTPLCWTDTPSIRPGSQETVKEGAGSVWLTLRGSDPVKAWAQLSRPDTSLITYCPIWFSFSFSKALQTQKLSFQPSRGFLFPATSQHWRPWCLSQKVLLGGVACLQQYGIPHTHINQIQSEGAGSTRRATAFLCPSSCFSGQPFFPYDLKGMDS